MSKVIRYKGKRFGSLVMIKPSRSGGAGIGAYWIAKCDCGTEKEVVARAVAAGRILTCGKCIYFKNLSIGLKKLTSRQMRDYSKAIAAATSDGTKWHISPMEFRNYIQTSCSICGDPPTNTKMKIERVSPAGAYSPDNCIVTCSDCRNMRSSWSLQTLLDKVKKIYTYLALDNS